MAAVKELLGQDRDGLREIVRDVMQAMLEAEMDKGIRRMRFVSAD